MPTAPPVDTGLPHSTEMERAVLGSILLLPNVLDDVALIVKTDDFLDHSCKLVYSHMVEMQNSGSKIDTSLLIRRLQKHEADWMQREHGLAFMADVARTVSTAAHAQHYATQVRDEAIKRAVVLAGHEVVAIGSDRQREADEILSDAESKVFAVRDRRNFGNERVVNISDVMLDAMAELDARQNGDRSFGLDTGFKDLDTMIRLRKQDLVILAARPSMGKSALASNIAVHVSATDPVLFVSLEMDRLSLCDRMLAAQADVNAHRMRNGTINASDRASIAAAASKMSQHYLTIDDSPRRSMMEIAAVARRAKRKSGLSLVIVDYLQLIQPDSSKEPREQQVAKISKTLKQLARDLDVCVLCLAQLNRQVEQSAHAKPKLSHLRESGAIEQDADAVLFVHRQEYYEPNREENKGKAEIIVAKQRNGPTGTAMLAWFEGTMEFRNLYDRAEDMPNYDKRLGVYNARD